MKVDGTALSEALTGSDGTDTIYGYAGNDTINALTGKDVLFGGYGNDSLDGGTGIDTIYGESGNDILVLDTELDVASGGEGIDNVELNGVTESVISNFTINPNNTYWMYWYSHQNDYLTNWEAPSFTVNDQITPATKLNFSASGLRYGFYNNLTNTTGFASNPAGIIFKGGVNQDLGTSNVVKLNLPNGNALVDSAPYGAVLLGNPTIGWKTVFLPSAENGLASTSQSTVNRSDISLNELFGEGVVQAGTKLFITYNDIDDGNPGAYSLSIATINPYTLPTDIENLIYKTKIIESTQQNLKIIGNSADNNITGGSGNDTLVGLGGNDTLIGLWGDDILRGDSGDDNLLGGMGYDTAVYSGKRNDYVIDLANTNILVKDKVGLDGVDTLGDVEFLSFSDKTYVAPKIINGTNIYSNLANAHLYEFKPAAISWSQALVDAAGTGYKGIRGYLATVTSASESDFIGLMIGTPGPGYNPIGTDSGYYWVGGSDKETESVWKWVTGPEKGNLIGSYSNWFPGYNSTAEPNGAPILAQRDEDGMALDRHWDYGWYDLPVEDISFPYGQYVKGYVVEYGGLPSTYALTSSKTSYDEGESIQLLISTTNIEWGSSVAYTITGIDAADLASGDLIGKVNVEANGLDGIAKINLTLASDLKTEGQETLNINVGGMSYSVKIQDTSLSNSTDAPKISSYILNPTNSHYYAFLTGVKSWQEAKDFVENSSYKEQKGYLATITSQEEDSFIYSNFVGPKNLAVSAGNSIGLGGSDAEKEGVWKWVGGPEKGQAFTYNSNFKGGDGTSQNYLSYWGSNINWDDMYADSTANAPNGFYGFVVEYGGTVQEPYKNESNGHYYEAISTNVNWETALKNSANSSYKGLGGYLLNITSKEEDTFVHESVLLKSNMLGWGSSAGYKSTWLGGSDAEIEGTWKWVSGPEAGTVFFKYTNSASGQYLDKYSHFNLSVYSLTSPDADYLFTQVPASMVNSTFDINKVFWDDIWPNPSDTYGSGNGYVIEYGGLPSTYTITSIKSAYDEGESIQLLISTTNIEWGSSVAYTITGIDAGDLSLGELTGKVTVEANGLDGVAKINLTLASDIKTEGQETLNISVGGVSYSVKIQDTSINKKIAGVTWSNASSLSTNESGTTATYGAVLDKAPTKDVTLTLTISDATEGVFVSTGTTTRDLVFTPSNWNQVQNVQVKGVDDGEYDRDVAYTISTKVTSGDLDYDGMRNAQGLPTSNVTVTNLDDDIPNEWRGTGNNDVYTSGPGADDLYGDYGRDEIYGGKGNDRIYGGYGDDVLSGDDGSDEIEGEQGNDKISGGTGDDNLKGGTGADTLYGGDGSDILNGGEDADSMDGGNGADTYYVDNPGDVVEDTGTDNSIDILYIASYLSAPVLLGRGVENATLNDSAGKGSITGNDSNNTLNGNASDNSLSGGSGNDTLESGAGNDSVDAGTGDDLIVGGEGAGNDTYVGGTGSDTVKYTSAVNTILVNLLTGLANGQDIGTDQLSQIENLIGGRTGDTLIGDDNANNINAYTGNDTITGNGGNDTVDGGEGQDTVVYALNASNYTVTAITGGYQVVSKSGTEGTDTLLNVESLKFADQTALISSFSSGTGTSTSAKFWKDNTKTPTDTKKADAVNLTDAIAILKMIVGLNVNSNNTPLSPYQAIAADFDQSGDVGLTDAIGVLKMVVGLSAPTPTWKYFDDTKLASAYTSAQSLNPNGWTTTAAISDTGTADSSVKLVGVLTGDVDGSWTGL